MSLIYHSLEDVNAQLRLGRYFFMDIVREGVVLFEASGHPFAEPAPPTPAEALKESQAYYAEWLESADRFFTNARDDMARHWNKEAAFLLHQAAERYYHTLFLVLTLYSPLCRARHKGDYAERTTMPMVIDFGLPVRRLGGFCAA